MRNYNVSIRETGTEYIAQLTVGEGENAYSFSNAGRSPMIALQNLIFHIEHEAVKYANVALEDLSKGAKRHLLAVRTLLERK
jgi:hypothetical protein